MLIGSLSIGLPLFGLGLALLIIGQILGIIPITFGGLGIAMLMYLPIFLIDWKKFKFINTLKDNKQIDGLYIAAKKYSLSNTYLEQEQARLATFVLIDLKSRDIGIILKDRLMEKNPKNVRQLLKAFNLLSIKLG